MLLLARLALCKYVERIPRDVVGDKEKSQDSIVPWVLIDAGRANRSWRRVSGGKPSIVGGYLINQIEGQGEMQILTKNGGNKIRFLLSSLEERRLEELLGSRSARKIEWNNRIPIDIFTYRLEGSLTRHHSTTSLKAREYL